MHKYLLAHLFNVVGREDEPVTPPLEKDDSQAWEQIRSRVQELVEIVSVRQRARTVEDYPEFGRTAALAQYPVVRQITVLRSLIR